MNEGMRVVCRLKPNPAQLGVFTPNCEGKTLQWVKFYCTLAGNIIV